MDSSQLLPVVGVVVGVILQFVLSRASETAKAKSVLRVQEYVDYTACVADSEHPRKTQDRAEVFARAANAKTRIAIYGSAGVITALAGFEKIGAEVWTAEQCTAFLSVISAMRSDGVGKHHVPIEDFEVMLFGDSRRARPE